MVCARDYVVCPYASLRTLSSSWQFWTCPRTGPFPFILGVMWSLSYGRIGLVPRIRLILFRLGEYASLSQKDLSRNAMTFSDVLWSYICMIMCMYMWLCSWSGVLLYSRCVCYGPRDVCHVLGFCRSLSSLAGSPYVFATITGPHMLRERSYNVYNEFIK